RIATYGGNGQLLTDNTTTVRAETSLTCATYVSNSTYSYTDSVSGQYLNGAVGTISSANYREGTYQSTALVTNSYVWRDNPLQNVITNRPDGSTTYTTTLSYNAFGQLTSAYIADGRPRTASYKTDAA